MSRRFRLRTIIGLLVLATTVPLGLFAAWRIYSGWMQQQDLVDEQNIEQARAVRMAIDQEIQQAIAALYVLAELEPIDRDDRAHFVDIARRLLPRYSGWESIRLVDPSLTVLADTASPQRPRPLLDTDWVRQVIETRMPATSGGRRDPETGQWIVSVGVPVTREGRLRSILGVRIFCSTFSGIIRQQRVPADGVVALVDSHRRIIARNKNEAQHLGGSPSPDFISVLDGGPEGAWRSRLLEGDAAYAAWSRSSLTGWTVGVGLPAPAVDAPIARSFYSLVAAGLAVLGVGLGVALLLSRGIVRTQRTAVAGVRSLAQGEAVPTLRSRIAEADDLFAGLREAAVILKARLEERDRAQRDADAHRAALLEREQAARRAAEALNRSKDEFIATVSHELRTPLNAIFGWVALLKTGSLDEDARRRALDIIDRNTRAQARLIEDLLDMSRIIQGTVRLDMMPVDLGAVLDAAVESLRPTADARQIALTTTREVRAVVSADQSRIQQVLWNLLSNALKFTPHGGRVAVSLAVEGDHAVVRVADTGEGIAPEFLPHVFDRFRQESADVTREHSGLGLGLSLVRYLTELHGGQVRADSPGKGLGATFSVRLPLLGAPGAPAVERAAPLAALPPGARPLQGVRILAVDDEQDTRDLLAAALGHAGAAVTTASSSREALAVLDSQVIDVVVSDIAMPDGSGYDLVRDIRASGRGASVPVVAVTAYSRAEDRDAALRAGFNAHIGKPFEPAALVHVLASLTPRP